LSDDSLRLIPASSVSVEEFAGAFTAGFSGYAHPVVLDATRLSRRMRQDHYALEHSIVAYEGGRAVGVAVLAVRREEGWVPGLGVIPERRGRGLGRRLMAELLARARGCGVRRLRLEVLARNATARRIYEELGMRVVRDLLLLERGAAPPAAAAAPRAAPRLKEADPVELLAHFQRLHAARPQWSRDLPALLVRGGMRGLHLGDRARPSAYALLTEGTDGFTYLSDLAASDASRARRLCAALACFEVPLKVINEPERGLFTAPLVEHGFREVERQNEMVVEL
jgi:GNAT superfamily N-acetyltransferase